jgi:hypothetical protein
MRLHSAALAGQQMRIGPAQLALGLMPTVHEQCVDSSACASVCAYGCCGQSSVVSDSCCEDAPDVILLQLARLLLHSVVKHCAGCYAGGGCPHMHCSLPQYSSAVISWT